jgi:hypothetical protein
MSQAAPPRRVHPPLGRLRGPTRKTTNRCPSGQEDRRCPWMRRRQRRPGRRARRRRKWRHRRRHSRRRRRSRRGQCLVPARGCVRLPQSRRRAAHGSRHPRPRPARFRPAARRPCPAATPQCAPERRAWWWCRSPAGWPRRRRRPSPPATRGLTQVSAARWSACPRRDPPRTSPTRRGAPVSRPTLRRLRHGRHWPHLPHRRTRTPPAPACLRHTRGARAGRAGRAAACTPPYPRSRPRPPTAVTLGCGPRMMLGAASRPCRAMRRARVAGRAGVRVAQTGRRWRGTESRWQ